jgi:hypothetical protein
MLNNFVGHLAWLTVFIFFMALEMQGLCGIRRLVVQGDLDLFHSVVSRSNFVVKSLLFLEQENFMVFLTCIFVIL